MVWEERAAAGRCGRLLEGTRCRRAPASPPAHGAHTRSGLGSARAYGWQRARGRARAEQIQRFQRNWTRPARRALSRHGGSHHGFRALPSRPRTSSLHAHVLCRVESGGRAAPPAQGSTAHARRLSVLEVVFYHIRLLEYHPSMCGPADTQLRAGEAWAFNGTTRDALHSAGHRRDSTKVQPLVALPVYHRGAAHSTSTLGPQRDPAGLEISAVRPGRRENRATGPARSR